MKKTQKSKRFFIVLILIIITPSISILGFFFLTGGSNISYNILDYFVSHKTLFPSSNPTLNIFWYLPENLQIIPLTVPQLIDIIIIFLVIFNVQYPLFPTVKRYYQLKNNTAFDLDLYFKKMSELEESAEPKKHLIFKRLNHILNKRFIRIDNSFEEKSTQKQALSIKTDFKKQNNNLNVLQFLDLINTNSLNHTNFINDLNNCSFSVLNFNNVFVKFLNFSISRFRNSSSILISIISKLKERMKNNDILNIWRHNYGF
ncbi:MAG: hypothetical protein EU551_00875 [Promethearchaeota archaeon]|nr:MAG: hypothetical protein EU551_00875 [Candidatus Lokiarchaeota archaeon]